MTPRKLALRIGVAAKTIERWVANENLVPHAANRAEVSAALGVSESVLWPKATKNVLKTGHDREIVAVYPYRSACPSSVWTDLIKRGKDELYFAGYTNYFLWLEQPAFLSTLQKKAESGCRVRFLVGDPELEITRMREQAEDVALTVSTRIRITLENTRKLDGITGIETRFSDALDAQTHMSLSVFRFDDEALVTPHLARTVGHDSPLLHLRRMEERGVFDRFAASVEELWNRGREVN
jgi:hypothetical protein